MKRLFVLVMTCLVGAPTAAQAALIERPFEYRDGETVCEGYLAYPEGEEGKRPGVLVVHEWKGLGRYAKSRARQLAELGYVAFAIDMYGKGQRAETHEEAAALSGLYRNDRDLMRRRAKAALDAFINEGLCDPRRIAAIGYCFGGTTVLEMARAGFFLRGVASFHGALSTPKPAVPGEVHAKIMVFHGAADSFVPAADVQAFREEMQRAAADFKIVEFPGAVHSFTVPEAGHDPSTGMAYDENADRSSWEMLNDFLTRIFA